MSEKLKVKRLKSKRGREGEIMVWYDMTTTWQQSVRKDEGVKKKAWKIIMKADRIGRNAKGQKLKRVDDNKVWYGKGVRR